MVSFYAWPTASHDFYFIHTVIRLLGKGRCAALFHSYAGSMALLVGSSHVFKITKALIHVDFPGVAELPEHSRGIRVFHPPRKKPENSGNGNLVT